MTKSHAIGSFAATAMVALLTGLPPASADELADLKANQELLQRRIDQLAQAQAPLPAAGGIPGGGTPAGIPGMRGVGARDQERTRETAAERRDTRRRLRCLGYKFVEFPRR